VLQWLLRDEENVKRAELEMKKDISNRKKTQKGQRKKRKKELRAVGSSNVTFRF